MALAARDRAARLHPRGPPDTPEGTNEGVPANPVRMSGQRGTVLGETPIRLLSPRRIQ